MIFCYTCLKCGKKREHEARIGHAPTMLICECYAMMERDYGAEHKDVAVNKLDGMYPYVSKRLAGKLTKDDARFVDTKVGTRHRARLPLIESREHERKLQAKYNWIRE